MTKKKMMEQLAHIGSRNHYHSSLNPNARYSFRVTTEQSWRTGW